jgi:hypothetical protein
MRHTVKQEASQTVRKWDFASSAKDTPNRSNPTVLDARFLARRSRFLASGTIFPACELMKTIIRSDK